MQISRIFGAKTTILRAFQTFLHTTHQQKPLEAQEIWAFFRCFPKRKQLSEKVQFFGKLSICQNMAELVIVTLLKGVHTLQAGQMCSF